MQTEHKQVTVNCFGNQIEVDKGISELLKLIWNCEIRTCLSCENNNPFDNKDTLIEDLKSLDSKSLTGFIEDYDVADIGVWIAFATPGDLRKFLDIVAKYPSDNNKDRAENFCDTMYSRIIRESNNCKHDWKYDFYPYDRGVKVEIKEVDGETWAIDKFSGKSEFNFEASVRFNKMEIPEIMKYLREYIDLKKKN